MTLKQPDPKQEDIPGKITIEDDGESHHPVFRYRMSTRADCPSLGFTMMSIPEDSRQWLLEVVCKQFQQAYEYGRREMREEIKKSGLELLEKAGVVLPRKSRM